MTRRAAPTPAAVLPGPDRALARSLVRQVRPVPVGRALRDPDGAMCLACGADLPGDVLASPCASCGTPTTLVSDGVPLATVTVLGGLHRRRAGLRKRPAMLVARGADDCTLLLHNGRTLTVAPGDLPATTDPGPGPDTPVLRSPVGPILRHAVTGDGSLPWPADLLLRHAFDALATVPWARRVAALDLLALGRPDLLGGCGLSRTETTWLTLVHGARRGDAAEVVAAAAALPPDRYRRKIAIVAALLAQLRQVPGAAERLAPALRAFAGTEPLAALAQRALGLAGHPPRQRIDDHVTRAGTFPVPVELVHLLDARAAGSSALLGARGRLAVLHAAADPDPGLAVAVSLDDAPLAVVDDLIDAGKVTDLATVSAGRPDDQQAYLTARIAPDRLSDAQLERVGHRDEAIRRRLLAGGTDPTDPTDPDRTSPMARHAASVDHVLRRRPQDVVAGHVLPAHREVARLLTDVITRADAGEEPAALLTGPLLADRSTWLPLVRLFGAERLRGAGGELVRGFSDFFEWLDLTAAREHLFLADWQRATDAARRCLELATGEAVRDEAQNLLACGLHNLGDHHGAMRELEQAIEGSYSVALLANIGVVAAHLDPELAAGHLGRIVREGPTTAMRVNAARQALAAWRSDDGKLWAGDGSDRRALPTVLREPLRSIVVERIDLDDFRAVVAALATHDAAWLTAPNSLRASPHRDTLDARYHLAVAAEDMFLSVVDVLATIQDWAAAPEWLCTARDELVHQTIDFLLGHIDDPDNMAGIVARALVTKVRGLPERDQVVLALLAVATLAHHVTEQDEELADGVVDLFGAYEGRVAALDAEQREAVAGLRELCVRRITLNLAFSRKREIGTLVDLYNAALDVLDRVQRGSPLWFRARGQVAETVDACQRTKAQLRPWVRKLEDADVRDMVLGFLDHCADLELKAQRVLGS
ncbi:hypothetical protein [Actinophytocola gossypii]|uniref:Tetratricopeptide repeat protein n=1 Tax=Actinophytocola gossypii TaxID=2812003 RepID=A0ABT2JL75_9PSEU|nr:hypothetical protein [Actinophytocola gossypii]MCT2588274.1 hypothetical protein [Actinophytocola gossypii]